MFKTAAIFVVKVIQINRDRSFFEQVSGSVRILLIILVAYVICAIPGNLFTAGSCLALRNLQVSYYTENQLEIKWLCYVGKSFKVSKP